MIFGYRKPAGSVKVRAVKVERQSKNVKARMSKQEFLNRSRGGNIIIYEKVIDEKTKLEKQIKEIQLRISKLPAGKLICNHNGKYLKWHVSDGKNKVYIPKKERKLIEQLAIKKYLTLQLKNLHQEQKALDAYLKEHNPKALQEEMDLINSTEFNEFLSSNFTPISQKLQKWMNEPYIKNMAFPEKLTHETYGGYCVRSKSEMLIDSFLRKYRIPFRYECLLQLGEICLYPDFTICHPITGEIFYWEHFGMFDKPEYCQKAIEKLQYYASKGIIPNRQLIVTFETKDKPLRMDEIERIIEQYFM